MLTKGEYLDLMRHAIGGANPATGHSLDATFQRAGRALFGAYSWPWRFRGPVTLNAVANEYDIDLPENFGSVVSLVVPNNITIQIHWTTPEQVIERRRFPWGGLCYFVSTHGWTGQVTPGVAPTKKLMIDRLPTTDGTPTFELTYLKDWVDLAGDNDVPDMPPEMEESLIRLCRARAWSLENDGEHPDEARAKAEMKDQWQEYGRSQRVLGRVRGGAGDRPRRTVSGGHGAYPPGFII
jgi:hypothetical protein